MASADTTADSVSAAAPGTIGVELAWSLAAGHTQLVRLRLPAGATARATLLAAGVAAAIPPEVLDTLALGRWGRVIDLDHPLADGDRLELLRPLRVDPKEARRLRYQRDGLRPRRRAPRPRTASRPAPGPAGDPTAGGQPG